MCSIVLQLKLVVGSVQEVLAAVPVRIAIIVNIAIWEEVVGFAVIQSQPPSQPYQKNTP
jgi:hypothetical protein